MADNELPKLTISELSLKIRAREVSPTEVVESALAQAERLQPALNSFITILYDQARSKAKEQEEALVRGEYKGPLHGIPIGIKDSIATAGIPTTAASKVFSKYIPETDAHVVKLCKDAGAIILGKENLDEFSGGATSNSPHFGPVNNPWALDHIPGGVDWRGRSKCRGLRNLRLTGGRWRRIGPPSRRFLRGCGPEADVRTGKPAWGPVNQLQH